MKDVELHDEYIAGDGVNLHVVTAGRGPPVILLHGFPENWRSWRHQIPTLTAAGFSVFVPDMRGYNLSSKPAKKDSYELNHLLADIVALVNATGYSRAHIVGHDWGGVVAWAFAERYPGLTDKLVIMNAPHMKIYLEKIRRSRQILKSWYMLFFQLPYFPEFALSAGNFRVIRRMFRSGPANREAFSGEDIEEYIAALSVPGALTAALNYYRANITVSNARRFANWRPINAEALVIWGELDPALSVELLNGLQKMVPRVHIHRIPRSSHWVQNEAPGEVNQVLLRFLKR
jgi:pimeloyl-ACP methyl ester carboxylesterase